MYLRKPKPIEQGTTPLIHVLIEMLGYLVQF